MFFLVSNVKGRGSLQNCMCAKVQNDWAPNQMMKWNTLKYNKSLNWKSLLLLFTFKVEIIHFLLLLLFLCCCCFCHVLKRFRQLLYKPLWNSFQKILCISPNPFFIFILLSRTRSVKNYLSVRPCICFSYIIRCLLSSTFSLFQIFHVLKGVFLFLWQNV